MKIIHTSDWLLGKNINGYSLLEDQRYFINTFINQISELLPDVILISGNIYDRHSPTSESSSLLNEALHKIVIELKIPVIMILGDRDSKKNFTLGTELMQKTGLFIIHEINKDIHFTLNDKYGPVYIHPIPYLELHEFEKLFPEKSITSLQSGYDSLLRLIAEEFHPNERHILMAHGSFLVSDMVENTDIFHSQKPIFIPIAKQFSYTALGHSNHLFIPGANNARYCGSPLKYDIDDNSEHGFLEIEIKQPGISPFISFHPIKPLHEIHSLAGRLSDFLKVSETENSHKNDFYFFHLSDEYPIDNAVLALKNKYPNLLGINYLKQNQLNFNKNNIPNPSNSSLKELFTSFYENQTGESMTNRQTLLINKLFEQISKEGNDR